MIDQATHSLILVNASKLSARGQQAIVALNAVSQVLADGPTTADVEARLAAGARKVTMA